MQTVLLWQVEFSQLVRLAKLLQMPGNSKDVAQRPGAHGVIGTELWGESKTTNGSIHGVRLSKNLQETSIKREILPRHQKSCAVGRLEQLNLLKKRLAYLDVVKNEYPPFNHEVLANHVLPGWTQRLLPSAKWSGRPKSGCRMVGAGEVVTVVAGVNEGSTVIIVILGYSLRNMSSPLKIG